jgi:hypothetical protein
VEYSLLEGITRQYHEFIPVNEIPLGFRSKCMEYSRDYHKIPMSRTAIIKKSYKEIYLDIMSFISKSEANNHYTPLFCLSKDRSETEFAMQFLYDEACVHTSTSKASIPKFANKVYDLEILVTEFGAQVKSDFSFGAARDLLTSCSYDYSPNTLCEFHAEHSVLYCSIGIAKRYSYYISDALCHLYKIKPTEKHLPKEKPVGIVMYSDDHYRKHNYFNSHRSSTNSSSSTDRLNEYGSASKRAFVQGSSSYSSLNRLNEDKDDQSEVASIYSNGTSTQAYSKIDSAKNQKSDNARFAGGAAPNQIYTMPSHDIRYEKVGNDQPKEPTQTQQSNKLNTSISRIRVSERLDRSKNDASMPSSVTANPASTIKSTISSNMLNDFEINSINSESITMGTNTMSVTNTLQSTELESQSLMQDMSKKSANDSELDEDGWTVVSNKQKKQNSKAAGDNESSSNLLSNNNSSNLNLNDTNSTILNSIKSNVSSKPYGRGRMLNQK